jgi:hypothetical protein
MAKKKQPTPLRVAILGVIRDPAELNDSILDDAGLEIWCINSSYEPPRWDRWFQLHGPRWMQFAHGPRYLRWLSYAAAHRRVYVYPQYADVFPGAAPFPVEDIAKEFGTRYLTGSFSLLTAFALYLGAREIHYDAIGVYGSGEQWQAECTNYWIGRAIERGVEIHDHQEHSGLLDERGGIYGYEIWGNE